MGTASPTPSQVSPPTSTRVSRRASAVAPSATLAIDSKAKALKASGEDVISFGAGEPDFPTMAEVVEAAAAACRDPKNHRYSPTAGLGELREAIAAATSRDSRLEVSGSQVLVTNGGKQAIAHAFATLLDPGDEVIVPAPYWTTYPESIALAGGRAVAVYAGVEQQFKVTVEQLEAALTPRTKALLMVSPSNPTGAVYDSDQLTAIGKWALERNLWVISDDIYEHLVYGGRQRFSLPELVPDLTERTILVNGVAKTYAMTGWRVGWLVGPSDIVTAAINLQSQETSNVANVSQRAAIAALELGPVATRPMLEAFNRRRKRMWELLNDIDGLECSEPEGAFYAFPSVEALLGKNLGGKVSKTSSELAENLLESEKVAVVPGEAFGAPGHARLSYALSDEDLERGIARIAHLVESS